jgi:hypothetical protein
MTLPYCWVHTKKIYGVEPKQSTIKGAGTGLFARRAFKKGDTICPLGGFRLTRKEFNKRYPPEDPPYTAPYTVELNGYLSEDGACMRIIGHYSNTAVNPSTGRIHKKYNNATIEIAKNKENKLQSFLVALRNISAGEEIFTYYGTEYRFDKGIHEYKYYPRQNRNAVCSRKKDKHRRTYYDCSISATRERRSIKQKDNE